MPDRIPEAILVARLLEQSPRSADMPATAWPKDIRHIAAHLDGAAPSLQRSIRHG